MKKIIDTTIFILVYILVIFSDTYAGIPITVNTVQEMYITGQNIANGVAEGIMLGIEEVDNSINYNIIHKYDKLNDGKIEFPIVETIIKFSGNIVGRSEISFVVILEISKENNIVGTIKRVKINGILDKNNEILNSMFIETDEGIEQVTLQNGEIAIVE